MLPLKARVQNGHFVVDQPTDLPEGTEVQRLLVEEDSTLDDLPPDERAELNAVLDAGIADMRAGRVVEGDEIVRRLLARS
jgi:predicted transcriptional regulator